MRASETLIATGIIVWELLASPASSDPSINTRLGAIEQMAAEGKVREAGLEARLLGEQLQQKGRYLEAVAALERSSELLGREDAGWLATRRELAETYDLAGMATRAEAVWLSLLAQFDSESDYDRDTRREILVYLASHHADHGSWDQAVALYSGVVESAERSHECDFVVQRACRALIQRFSATGDYQRAVDASRTLVRCVETRVSQVPGEKEDLIRALRSHSVLAESAGQLDEAEVARAKADRLSRDPLR